MGTFINTTGYLVTNVMLLMLNLASNTGECFILVHIILQYINMYNIMEDRNPSCILKTINKY